MRERGFCFYAGVPLIASHGHAVGTLCLPDYRPRRFTYFDLELLGLMARRVLGAIEQRHAKRHPETPGSAYSHLHSVDAELDVFGRSLFTDLAAVKVSHALERRERVAMVGFAAPRERLASIVAALRRSGKGGLIGRLGAERLGWIVPGESVERARDLASRSGAPDALLAAVDLAGYHGATELALVHVEEALGEAGLH